MDIPMSSDRRPGNRQLLRPDLRGGDWKQTGTFRVTGSDLLNKRRMIPTLLLQRRSRESNLLRDINLKQL
jgi:hypothetical protein